MSIYTLKPRFQALLRPLTARLASMGITANFVTILGTLGSIVVGVIVAWKSDVRPLFLIIPLWLLVRMALNAIDGMLAREFSQQSVLGGYLNEMGDLISDAALYVPFAFISPFGWIGIVSIVVLSIITEYAGVLGPLVGASRRYDGPMGKSDRAALFGALGLWVGVSTSMPLWLEWAIPVIAALLVLTAVNRVRAGIREAANPGSLQH